MAARCLFLWRPPVGMGVNAGPDDTLADEAARIGLARDESAYPGNWSAIPLYNCGVMIARAGLFRELRRAYDREADGFYQRTTHRARCQWLIGYLLHRLGVKVDLLGPEIHTHGHFGLPAGCRMDGGVCRYGDQVGGVSASFVRLAAHGHLLACVIGRFAKLMPRINGTEAR